MKKRSQKDRACNVFVMIKSSRLSLDQQKTYITFMGSRYNTLAKKYRIMNLTEF